MSAVEPIVIDSSDDEEETVVRKECSVQKSVVPSNSPSRKRPFSATSPNTRNALQQALQQPRLYSPTKRSPQKDGASRPTNDKTTTAAATAAAAAAPNTSSLSVQQSSSSSGSSVSSASLPGGLQPIETKDVVENNKTAGQACQETLQTQSKELRPQLARPEEIVDKALARYKESVPHTTQSQSTETNAAPLREPQQQPTVLLDSNCWSCHVPVGGDSLYALHQHALLSDLPLCVVCAEEAAVRQQGDSSESSESVAATVPTAAVLQERSSYCAACLQDEAELETFLFLCDAPACGRAICRTCIHSLQGEPVAAALEASDDEWRCLVCRPIRIKLPLDMAQTAEQVWGKLVRAEAAKQECLEELDQEELRRSDFDETLQAVVSPGEELDDAVDDAVQEWQDQWSQHLQRLEDTISSLQDTLVLEHEIDLADGYKKLAIESDVMNEEDGKEPEWVRQAHWEVDERQRKRRFQRFDPLDKEAYEEEDWSQVEGLEPLEASGDEESGERLLRLGWSQGDRPSKRQIQVAMAAEAQVLEENQVVVEGVADERQDTRETIQEEKQEAGAGTTTRRRNAYRRVPETSPRKSPRPPTARGPKKPAGTIAPRVPPAGPASRPRTVSFGSRAASAPASLTLPAHVVRRKALQTPTDIFDDSPLVLTNSEQSAVRTVAVAKELAKSLKPHQVDGIRFMWRNLFSDFDGHLQGNEEDVGGCILAHIMGSGKSIQTIALLHAAMTHPSMVHEETCLSLLHTALLVVPVNTLASWEHEFDKWVGHFVPTLSVYNLGADEKSARSHTISSWAKQGGILLVSDSLFVRLSKQEAFKGCLQPDVLVLDEAHLALKTATSETYKQLLQMKTKRILALTGSPLQNSLFEFFRMVNFVRPGLFGYQEESKFDDKFVGPIMRGMASDASEEEHALSLVKSNELHELLLPHVHRVGAVDMSKDLPPIQQVVLHTRQSRWQSRLYQAYKRQQNDGSVDKNFFKTYQDLKPVHNHPACLLLSGQNRSQPQEASEENLKWWADTCKPKDYERLRVVENGFKVVLLLHILAHAEQIGDKVLVFTQCLKTLDYLETVLALEDWSKHAPSLRTAFPNGKFGGWQKSHHYLRIDGQTSSSARGDLISKFNKEVEGAGVRAFLISSLAGGMGINLTAANRVVLFDSHFNPTIMTQALYRTYRYGQKKSVFCYRLLTEGTIEEKVYGRSVNKSGVALRVIDRRSINRAFSRRELLDLQETYTWVQCDDCNKWRMLIGKSSEANLSDEWYCKLNETDPRNNSCQAPERSQKWYEKNVFSGVPPTVSRDSIEPPPPDGRLVKAVERDEILKQLLQIEVKTGTKASKATLVSRHYCHDALLEAEQDAEEVERAQDLLERSAEAAALNVAVTEDGAAASLLVNANTEVRAEPTTDALQPGLASQRQYRDISPETEVAESAPRTLEAAATTVAFGASAGGPTSRMITSTLANTADNQNGILEPSLTSRHQCQDSLFEVDHDSEGAEMAQPPLECTQGAKPSSLAVEAEGLGTSASPIDNATVSKTASQPTTEKLISMMDQVFRSRKYDLSTATIKQVMADLQADCEIELDSPSRKVIRQRLRILAREALETRQSKTPRALATVNRVGEEREITRKRTKPFSTMESWGLGSPGERQSPRKKAARKNVSERRHTPAKSSPRNVKLMPAQAVAGDSGESRSGAAHAQKPSAMLRIDTGEVDSSDDEVQLSPKSKTNLQAKAMEAAANYQMNKTSTSAEAFVTPKGQTPGEETFDSEKRTTAKKQIVYDLVDSDCDDNFFDAVQNV